MEYPKTRTTEDSIRINSQNIKNPYSWRENTDDPDVEDWAKEQNQLLDGFIKDVDTESIKKTAVEYFNRIDVGFPTKIGKYYYYSKTLKGKRKRGLFRQSLDFENELLMFDPNLFFEESDLIFDMIVTPDENYVALSVADSGSDWRSIKIFQIDTQRFLTDQMYDVRLYPSIVWSEDSSGFYYSAHREKNKQFQDSKIWFHKLNTMKSMDQLIFEIDIPHPSYTGIQIFKDWKIVNNSRSTDDTTTYYISKGNAQFQNLFEKKDLPLYIIKVHDDIAYGICNIGTTNWRVIKFNLNSPDISSITDIIPEDNLPIDVGYSTIFLKTSIIVKYIEGGMPQIKIFDYEGGRLVDFPSPGIGTINLYQTEEQAFFEFSNLYQTYTMYIYQEETNTSKIFVSSETKIKPDKYVLNREFCKTKDGVDIPLLITGTHETMGNKVNKPTILYVYGGYGGTYGLYHHGRIPQWLDEGSLYVYAGVRGGGEYGPSWHQQGKGRNKQRAIDDVFEVAEFLINKGYTSSNKLCIFGESHGGVIVGAAGIQRPELFKAVISGSAPLDMLLMLQSQVGKHHYSEFGNPDDLNDFEAIMNYSPFHNITKRKYPAFLVKTGSCDDRVSPSGSYKFIASLQSMGSGGPFFLYTAFSEGHGYSSSESTRNETTILLSFLDKILSQK